MDILKAEIARKHKLLEDRNLIHSKKKYFKRGDLIAQQQEEYLKKYGKRYESTSEAPEQKEAINEFSTSHGTDRFNILPRLEVIRKLRERCEPVLLFGETESDACHRLRRLEISAPEINRGFRNDFQEAMEEVDQAYLKEILTNDGVIQTNKDKQNQDQDDLDESVTYESIQEMAKKLGRGNKDHDMHVIVTLLRFLLKQWNEQFNLASQAERQGTRSKMARATFTQTRVYVKPLLRKLKNKKIPEDILDSLTDIAKCLLRRDYLLASDAYLTMAIGNAPWPIGVTMVGIHARTGREKIFSKNVAHVMNDETQRKYIQGLKRLMTKCQELYPTDPSKMCDYVSKKDVNLQLKNI